MKNLKNLSSCFYLLLVFNFCVLSVQSLASTGIHHIVKVNLKSGPGPSSPPINYTTNLNVAFTNNILATVTPVSPATNNPASVLITSPVTQGTLVNHLDGTVTYTPNSNFNGPDGFSFTVADNNGNVSNPINVSITVYGTPRADNFNASVYQKSSVVTNVLSQASSPNGTVDATSVQIVTVPQHGSAVARTDGTVLYTPTPSFYGADSYGYTFKDSKGVVSNTGTVSLTVDGLPTANNDASQTFQNTAVVTNVVGNDTSPSGSIDPGTVVIHTLPANGTTSASLDGTVTYTPSLNFYGTDTYTYSVNDNSGAPSNNALVTITVFAKPTATPIAVKTIEDKPVTTDVSAQVHSTDGTINKASVVILNPPAHGVAQPSVARDGTVVYTPDSGFFGTDTYSVTLTDSNGATSDPVVVTITIDAPPVIANANVNTPPSTPLSTDIVALTTEATGSANIDKTSVSLQSNPLHGTAVARNDGTVLYTPVTGFVGAETYTVNIKNTSGNVSNTASISILVDVAPVNKGGKIIATTSPTSGVAVNTNILNFVQDPGGSSALDKASVQIPVDPSHGTVVSNGDGTITYTPAAGYYGPDSYSFSIADNLGLRSNTAMVTIAVYAQPILKSQNLVAVTSKVLHIDVLAGAYDPDGTMAANTDSITNDPVHGKVVFHVDGSVDYISDSLYHGPDSFSLTAKDNNGITSLVANFDLNVDRPPILRDSSIKVIAGQPYSYNAALKPAAIDIDGSVDPASISIVQPPTHGLLNVNANGTFIYTSTQQFYGRDSLQYTVKDNLGVVSLPAKIIIATALFSDLGVTLKLNNTDVPTVGSNLSFTVTVVNKGPDIATKVKVTDSLPIDLDRAVFQLSSLGKVSSDPTGKNVLWAIDSLKSGATANMSFQVRVSSGGPITDLVRVSANEVDLNQTNNTALITSVQSSSDDIFIPNIITPNGDGKNDFFVILGTNHYSSAALHVFSRWGAEVFQSPNYHNNWDGSRLLNGTYYYVLDVTNSTGIHFIHKGWVQIQR